jgi:hypothetical protein
VYVYHVQPNAEAEPVETIIGKSSYPYGIPAHVAQRIDTLTGRPGLCGIRSIRQKFEPSGSGRCFFAARADSPWCASYPDAGRGFVIVRESVCGFCRNGTATMHDGASLLDGKPRPPITTCPRCGQTTDK